MCEVIGTELMYTNLKYFLVQAFGVYHVQHRS